MFTTKIEIKPSAHKIDYASRILTLGSCFSENIGSRLQNACFDTDINPFGVLFNPASIAQSIELLLQKKEFSADDLFLHNSLWGSYMHSTLFSDSDKDRCLAKINSRFTSAVEKFHKVDFLMLTFGTAWVYKLAETDKIVANCHKVPATKFIRERLTVDVITETYNSLIKELKKANPDLKIVFTVSPVRHWKDGHTENNISKGILLQAIQEILKLHKNTLYFPAYELVLDELRDYRFYAADMLHPSEVAVDYLFQSFSNAYFDQKTIESMNEVMQYKIGFQHRPSHTDTVEYEKFVAHLKLKKQELLNKYPILSDRI